MRATGALGTPAASSAAQQALALGYAPWLESGIYQQTLYPQDWVCVANAAHPRINRTLSLQQYRDEAHAAITAGTGNHLLEGALARAQVQRTLQLELPGFLGLGAIVSTTDLIATLPRNIGETLARMHRLAVFDCPLAVPTFEVKQHWHARITRTPPTAGCAAWLPRCSCAAVGQGADHPLARPARQPAKRSRARRGSRRAAPARTDRPCGRRPVPGGPGKRPPS